MLMILLVMSGVCFYLLLFCFFSCFSRLPNYLITVCPIVFLFDANELKILRNKVFKNNSDNTISVYRVVELTHDV